MRADRSGISLTKHEAAIVKGMLERGDRQHDIAAWFGVNGGRIAEISTGARFASVEPATEDLPEPGPYLSGQQAYSAVQGLNSIRALLENAMHEVDRVLADAERETE